MRTTCSSYSHWSFDPLVKINEEQDAALNSRHEHAIADILPITQTTAKDDCSGKAASIWLTAIQTRVYSAKRRLFGRNLRPYGWDILSLPEICANEVRDQPNVLKETRFQVVESETSPFD